MRRYGFMGFCIVLRGGKTWRPGVRDKEHDAGPRYRSVEERCPAGLLPTKLDEERGMGHAAIAASSAHNQTRLSPHVPFRPTGFE